VSMALLVMHVAATQSPRALLAQIDEEVYASEDRVVTVPEAAPKWLRGFGANELDAVSKEANAEEAQALKYTPKDAQAVRVSLDSPPETRWDSVVAATNASLWALLRSGYVPVNVDDGKWNSSWLTFDYAYPTAVEDMRELFSAEQWQEMRGIARISRLPLLAIVAMNMIYELNVARTISLAEESGSSQLVGCSGVLVADEAGVVLHGRNLDYDMRLRQVTRRVDFVRGDAVVFTSVGHWVGNTGSPTVMVPGGWSASQNTRIAERRARAVLDGLFVRGRMPMLARLREIAQRHASFPAAIKALSEVPLPSASFFVVGGSGPWEGAVLSRDADTLVAHEHLDSPLGRWSLVQTNYDVWEGAPFGDDRWAALRRALALQVGQKAFATLLTEHGALADLVSPGGRPFGVADMWSVMRTTRCSTAGGESPPFNADTVYTSVMVPHNRTAELLVNWETGPSACLPLETTSASGVDLHARTT